MNRRSFLKDSIGALLFAGLSSNKVLAQVVETLTPNSPKVLLYLIQLKTGEWKIRATKWVDLPTKRLTENNIIKETFKAIEIVELNEVAKKRLEYWDKYNCSGRMGSLVSLGIPMTEEMKKEYIEYAKSHKGLKRNIQTKNKIALKAIGRKGTNKGKKFSDESRKKMSESGKKKKLSKEHKQNIGKSVTGYKNGFYGKTHSNKTKNVILEKHPSKIKGSCVHCHGTFDLPNLNRYHGDNCKLKDIKKTNEEFLLSNRSIKIIQLLDNGYKYKEITELTGFSKNTIIKTNRIYKSVFCFC